MKNGKLIFVIGPSGVGKDTIVNRVVDGDSFCKAISHTTRDIRPGEQNGVDYHFISNSEFREFIGQGVFHEYALVYENYYGTMKTSITNPLKTGINIIKIIEVDGAREMQKIYPDANFIFINAPVDVLKQRLINRGDKLESIIKRLKRVEYEVSCIGMFNSVIINDDLNVAVQEFLNLLK